MTIQIYKKLQFGIIEIGTLLYPKNYTILLPAYGLGWNIGKIDYIREGCNKNLNVNFFQKGGKVVHKAFTFTKCVNSENKLQNGFLSQQDVLF